MDIQQLRLKHKTRLINHAITIYDAKEIEPLLKQQYIDDLLAGGNLHDVLYNIKNKDLCHVSIRKSSANDEFLGSVVCEHIGSSVQAGEVQRVQVTVDNQSSGCWEWRESAPLSLSYHWYTSKGDIYFYDGRRTAISGSVVLGQPRALEASVLLPAEPGKYLLELTMVLDGHCWCEERGLRTQLVPVHVELPKLSSIAERFYHDLRCAISKQ